MAARKSTLKKLNEIKEGMAGAVGIAIAFATPFLHSRRTRWGATEAEVCRSLPGDDLVPHHKWGYTLAVTIRASAAEIWPWLVQIGQGRGGFYSYEWLENLIGCNMHNADRIIPEFQHLEVGDEIRHHPKLRPYDVAVVEPGWALVLHDTVDTQTGNKFELTDIMPEEYINVTYGWFLDQLDDGTTRFISRGRYDYRGMGNTLGFSRFFLEPIAFATSRKILLGIKHRAEAASKQGNR
jgi:hypothetical protein